MLMEARTKYNMAGVQIFDKSIIQYYNIIFLIEIVFLADKYLKRLQSILNNGIKQLYNAK
jgi:hypothetical protein